MSRKVTHVESLSVLDLYQDYCEKQNSCKLFSELLANNYSPHQVQKFIEGKGSETLTQLLQLNRRLIADAEYAALNLLENQIDDYSAEEFTSIEGKADYLLRHGLLTHKDRNAVVELVDFLLE